MDLIGGPVTEEFVDENPQVNRTIAIRSDQTLDDLHWTNFDAFDREEDHMYQFEIGGKEPMDRAAHLYSISYDDRSFFGHARREDDSAVSKIGMLGIQSEVPFYYWFDFGDDWWHEITLLSISKVTIEKNIRWSSKKRVTARLSIVSWMMIVMMTMIWILLIRILMMRMMNVMSNTDSV